MIFGRANVVYFLFFNLILKLYFKLLLLLLLLYFGGQFGDVAKVMIIPRKILAKYGCMLNIKDFS
jgi:hypothetical protein